MQAVGWSERVAPEPDAVWGADVVREDVLGAPCLVYGARLRHLGDLLGESRRSPDALYLVQGDRRLTFADTDSAVSAVRALLGRRGVRRGDHVLILGANSVELVVAYWAVVRSGAVAVLGNAWWSREQVVAAVGMVAPRLVVHDEKRGLLLPAGAPRVGYDEVRRVHEAAGASVDGPAEPVDEDEPATIIFTSGTEGRYKAAQLTHRGLVAGVHNLMAVTNRLPRSGPRPAGSVSLLSMPLFHIGGLQQVLVAMTVGGTLVFSEGRFDPARIVELMRRERVKVWSAAPTMAARVVEYLEESGTTVPTLRTLGMGASAVSESLRRRVREAFPAARRGIGVTWGLTEAGGAVTTAAGAAVESRPGCVGRVLPTSEVRVAEPAPDGSGELLVRSPSVMLGYLGSDVQPVDEQRWLRTGDVGRVDEDGFVYVTDRVKDIIIRGGENIAAAHVEQVLLDHPDIAEVAVVGLPDPGLGEVVGAIVRGRGGGALDEAELTEFCATRLAHFEVPVAWRLVADELPKNATGKVLKAQLRTEWQRQRGGEA